MKTQSQFKNMVQKSKMFKAKKSDAAESVPGAPIAQLEPEPENAKLAEGGFGAAVGEEEDGSFDSDSAKKDPVGNKNEAGQVSNFARKMKKDGENKFMENNLLVDEKDNEDEPGNLLAQPKMPYD